jgi:mono/diheme cytochrome c family protein
MKWHRVVFVLAFLPLGALSYWAQEKAEKPSLGAQGAPQTQPPAPTHVFTLTEEDKARKNPVHFSELSVARGAKAYKTECAMCHGEKADGKGDLAEDLKLNPPSLAKPDTLKDRADGELFTIIKQGAHVPEGTPAMPPEASRLTDRQIWDLVNYLRSLSGKAPEKPTEEEKQEGTVAEPKTKPPQR